MDPNINEPTTLPPAADANVSQTNKNEIENTKKVSRKLVFTVSLLLAILIPTGIFAYTKFQANSYKSVTVSPSPVAVTKPNPDPTANWQTYNFDNFSLKYPSDWKLIPCPNGISCIYDSPPSYEKSYSSLENNSKTIDISINQSDLSAVTHGANNKSSEEDFYNVDNPNWRIGISGGGIEMNYQKPTLITLGGNKFVKQISYLPSGAVPEEGPSPTQDDYNSYNYDYYFFVSESRVLNFRFSLFKTDTKDLALAEQVLSTFKFTESSPSADSATPSAQ